MDSDPRDINDLGDALLGGKLAIWANRVGGARQSNLGLFGELEHLGRKTDVE